MTGYILIYDRYLSCNTCKFFFYEFKYILLIIQFGLYLSDIK